MVSAILVSICTCILSLIFWPFVLLITLINEICRLFIKVFLLPKNYKLIESCFGNFLWSDMFNTRMVVAALYSPENSDLSKDIHRFQQMLKNAKPTESSKSYENLKYTQVGKLGYGCLRDDRNSFRLSNHVKPFNMAAPQNGEYFTEEEFSRVILPEYLSANMDESKPQWEWLLFPRVQRADGTFNSLRVFRWDHRYMDGACAGVLMSECIFDPWVDPLDGLPAQSPPYIYNPTKPPPFGEWLFVAKLWAIVHLPLILALSLVELFTITEERMGKKPFATWKNKGRKVCSSVYSMDVSELKVLEGGDGKRRNYNFKSALLTVLGPIMSRTWSKLNKNNINLDSEMANVATFQALLPYKKGQISNQFTILQANVPVSGAKFNGKIIDFLIDMTFFFPYVYTQWIGRLPIWFIQRLAAPAEATVALNSVPFLKKVGSICGSQITEIASWDCLYTPVGLDVTVMGYGGKMFLSAFSVEECVSYEEINNLVKNFVAQLKG